MLRRRSFLVLAAAASPALAQPRLVKHDAPGWPLDAVDLVDHRGQRFTRERLVRHWTFVLLGDTSGCGAACDEALAALGGLLRRIERTNAIEATQVLFVSYRPETDTLDRLRDHVAAFDARIIGATGNAAALQRLAEDLGAEPAAPQGTLVLVGPDALGTTRYAPPFDVPLLTADYLKTRVRNGCVCKIG